MRRIGVLYVANDFTALLAFNRRLGANTLLHHAVATRVYLFIFSRDFQTNRVAQSAGLYLLAATSTFLVNFQLGLRFLFPPGALDSFRRRVGWWYVTVMAVTWLWQAGWVYNTTAWDLDHIAHIIGLGVVIYDDVVLMKWLLRQ